MEEKNIQVTVKVELQDYLKFAKLSGAKCLYIFYGFFICLIIENIIEKDISSLILILILFVGYEIYYRISLKKSFESNKLNQKEEVFKFTERGIEIIKIDGSSNLNIKWDELYGIKHSKDILYLMTGSSSGYVIPKKLLDAEQIADLEGLIKDKLDFKLLKKVKRFKYLCIGVSIQILAIVLLAVLKIISSYF
ncbi:hypothetical protein Ga0466249_004820 [Sporomusaceae bacterium BoRhaA]|uniref:YcxB family protein n=1 Tax=Pelorhabdus rhamnosifermentans TaxID=2772457 RepID=UPI001C0617ED|nr:YcxB family protein [Pelorhabdus rhamnosifermentans]MBU2703672.1 hypothetical protein [Pelorhabdus rhamnosifermentans]